MNGINRTGLTTRSVVQYHRLLLCVLIKMQEKPLHNKLIIKNSFFLYIRMFLSIIVSLYTSRVVLQTLGATDYGVYGLVGSIVTLFTFLNTSMSGATSRFLTYEIGKGNKEKLKETFSTAMSIHIGIAIAIFVCVEIAGFWLLPKLDIPENRRFAAQIVFQLSILSVMVSVTQVPYNATIIAHEKMDVYAYVEMMHVILKLIIVYILMIVSSDKLILYAILILIINTIVAAVYRIYCIKNYEESHFKLTYNKTTIKKMLSFSLWDLYGNMSISLRQQGTNIIINKFFGVHLNAASGIATMVQSIISGFSTNVLQAFRPQIIKNYSNNEYQTMQNLMQNAIKFATIMQMFVSIPLFIEMDYVMLLWLGDVPEYAAAFCRILLLVNIVGVFNSILNTAIHATGKIKKLSFVNGTIALICLPALYITYMYINKAPECAYIIQLLAAIAMTTSGLIILKKQIQEIKITSLVVIAIKTYIPGFIVCIVCKHAIIINNELLHLFVTTTISTVIIAVYSFYVLCTGNERKTIVNFITTKLHLKNET